MVIIQNSEKIGLANICFYTAVFENFIKLVIYQKLIKILMFYNKYLVVYTSSFVIRANVKFFEKKCLTILCPSTIVLKFLIR